MIVLFVYYTDARVLLSQHNPHYYYHPFVTIINRFITPLFNALLPRHQVHYMLGAPILMNAMLAYPGKKKFTHAVTLLTGGAPPPPSVIQRFKEEVGIHTRTGYGLTESYGPASTHQFDEDWTGKSF